MGIKGLWALLAPTARNMSLTEIAIREGFQMDRHNTRSFLVGVDVSTWFYECVAAFQGHGRTRLHVGPNPELRALFFRLAWLSRSAVNAVFVFDGPNRPKLKRGKQVRAHSHWLLKAFQELVGGFGFYSHQAPGEAEAELAYLNRIGAIDAVLTSDSDIFIFGASEVIRSPQDPKKHDEIQMYTVGNRSECQELSPAGLLMFAIVNGGDYHPGLDGCGTTLSHALASSPLALSLYDAATTLDGSDLQGFLSEWRLQLIIELKSDPHGVMGRKYASAAAKIPSSFPSAETLKLYTAPLTSHAIAGPQFNSAVSKWLSPRLPSTGGLAALCHRFFEWGPEIINRFSANLWDGLFIRSLMHVSLTKGLFGQKSIRHISKAGIKLTSPTTFPSYRTEFWVPSVVLEATKAIADQLPPGISFRGTTTTSITVWVPEPILAAAVPEQLAAFCASHNAVATPTSHYQPVLSDLEVCVGGGGNDFRDEEGPCFVDLTGEDDV